ncbi:MAG: hypothetical protein WCW87_01570 [Candidatus Paceibacterota bacterium]
MKKIIFSILVSALPVFAFAQTSTSGGLQGVLDTANVFLAKLIPFIIGLAVLVFLWGILKFIMNAGDEDARKEGRQLMLYGIIGLFVMVSVWGLVRILSDTLNLNKEAPAAPAIPRSGGFGS